MASTPPRFLPRDARPPIPTDAAPAKGGVEADNHPDIRPTAVPRPWVTPLMAGPHPEGHDLDDPAVRRYWTALLGSGAVADLLRLTVAAIAGASLRQPLHLGLLLHEGLVLRHDGHIVVRTNIPPLEHRHLRRLRPSLRAEYRRLRPVT